MPRIDNTEQQASQSQNQTNQFNSQAQNQQAGFNQANQSQPKGLLTIPPAILQMVPWIPLMLEMATGQKIPAMNGTMAEIQTSLAQIQTSLAQVVNYQQQL
jgi:hypothetical protein